MDKTTETLNFINEKCIYVIKLRTLQKGHYLHYKILKILLGHIVQPLRHSKMTTAMFIVRCRHRHHSPKSPVCGTRKDQ